ncbi:DUF1579 family protein [Streptomyces sp. NPDC057474]|uniref:DUF1579 family protein n=1 Tax=Streptomyces sp. NPDC057474 TaxID=3346144 RepID=UPI0036B526F0
MTEEKKEPGRTSPRVVAVNRGAEQADGRIPRRGPRHDALDAWIGRWINEGHMIEADGTHGAPITTSDVYEWAVGGFFVLHTAYGRIGDLPVGGTEIIGYDETTGTYTSHFYDSQGNITLSTLTADGDTWTYQGETTRSTVHFTDDHRVQAVLHERTDDGRTYNPSMRVTLTKIA